jgi:hypothetical protein
MGACGSRARLQSGCPDGMPLSGSGLLDYFR